MPTVSREAIDAALATVNDPEIRRPITDLGMVEKVDLGESGDVAVAILLTVVGCPLRDTITRDITTAVSAVAGVTSVSVSFGVMTDAQRGELQASLRGGAPEKTIPFSQPSSLTRVFAIASGKGGVGKSSVTVNLAVALAAKGAKVGLVDADVYGHSIPAMLGIADERPTQVESMIMPVPTAYGVSVISIGMLKPKRDQVVAWRGPMLDRALVQMLADVFWGDLDVLLLDLPPGTGDIAISLGQHLPGAEVLVVTTPQEAAAEVAERAGSMAGMMRQRIAGVVENMSYLVCPHCGDDHHIELFGSGGGQRVADTLTTRFGHPVALVGQVPLDVTLREGGDSGRPIVATHPESAAAQALTSVADALWQTTRSLVGRPLSLTPTR